MRDIEEVAANVPYMTCPGNHEQHDNFSHYDARFTMIGDRHRPDHKSHSLLPRINNHFWSVDIGPVHFLLFSTEYYFYTNFGWEQIERQYRFLEEDLKRANANRAERPWIVVMGHRPLYYSNPSNVTNHESMGAVELYGGVHMHNKAQHARQFGLEDLFHKYGVDMQFYGHEHIFSRMYPLYKFKVANGTKSANPYDNPNGPIHFITGSAGNREMPSSPKQHHKVDYIANRFVDYGYTRMKVVNSQQITLEMVSDNKNGSIIDAITIIKDHPYPKWMPKW